MNVSKYKNTYVLYAVLMQPLLVVFQFLLIFVLGIPEEQTTLYRVLMTAVPLSGAIVICFARRPKLFLVTYVIVLFFLMCQSILYPVNASMIWSSTTRFLLPIILPSALCLISVKPKLSQIDNVLLKISWAIVGLMGIFVLAFFTGNTVAFGYNMPLAYALLLPTLTLYKNIGLYSKVAFVFLLLCMLIFGSRGPLAVACLYIIYDLIQTSKKNLLILVMLLFLTVSILPLLADQLDGLGISSRTLNFILSGDFGSAEGRDEIYPMCIKLINENWFAGVGIFGDRIHLDEECHNFILEILVNYGVILGTLILVYIGLFFLISYIKLDDVRRNYFAKFVIAFFIPLMVSDSYLISIYFGLFWGLILVLNNERKFNSCARINHVI